LLPPLQPATERARKKARKRKKAAIFFEAVGWGASNENQPCPTEGWDGIPTRRAGGWRHAALNGDKGSSTLAFYRASDGHAWTGIKRHAGGLGRVPIEALLVPALVRRGGPETAPPTWSPLAMSFLFKTSKTFKPQRHVPEDSTQHKLQQCIAKTLGSGNLRQAVQLPEGEDINEWIAVNTVDFFNQINMLYGTLTEFCTAESCPVMSAGAKYEYHWADGVAVKKPLRCSAPEYIDYLMTWIQTQLDDQDLFPTAIGVPFPKGFMGVAKTIHKRLFRVYAHIYHTHFDKVLMLEAEAHLNTSFKHFTFFITEFAMIQDRELAPMLDLIHRNLKSAGIEVPETRPDSASSVSSSSSQPTS